MNKFQKTKKLLRKVVFAKAIERYQHKKISQILSQPDNPIYYDSDEIFKTLQDKYPCHSDYGYDFYSSWNRGMQRSMDIIAKFKLLRNPGMKILEAGCGDGMVGYALKTFGHEIMLTDKDDWRHDKTKDMNFVKSDLCKIISLNSEIFDFIFSYNTFEHVENPQLAFNELVRVCKKGGYIYLDFGPLYASPWGLHAFETLRMPYPQYLFSKDFIDSKLKTLGIFDLGKKQASLQSLNKWRVKDFINMCSIAQCKIISFSKWGIEKSYLDIIIKYSAAFTGRGLNFDDVTVEEIGISIKKE